MNNEETIEILEALASGCSPKTGELIEDDSVLNERDVIRALQIAILNLKENNNSNPISSLIPEDEINQAIALFQSVSYNPSYSRLTHFFLRTKMFEYSALNVHPLYGKYNDQYSNVELHKIIKLHLINNGFSLSGKVNRSPDDQNWKNVPHFESPTFNKLSEMAVNQLKEKINEIGIIKTENLSDTIIKKRLDFPRANEPWSIKEKELLKKALEYTNDLELLVTCFQRSHGSLRSAGKKIIYAQQNINQRL
ncbi:hypothetical protein [Flavicella marina]|uniref:hypothetical protein n=1 Tax=Flavicella marina TaxID=1475951 RepID=UPI001263F7D4|nr:hypothetical protein [Flavicella marina]